jgi:pyruvate-formate lyase-activating enzyme
MSSVAPHIALMLTRRCNMTCGHCSVASGPQVKGEPAEADLLGYLRRAATAGVRSIQLTGGEPMLREPLVLRLLHECQRLGLASATTTNGFWGGTLADARRRLKALRRAGLVVLTVSYDRYHAEFQDPRPLLNIARAADELTFPVNINIVRVGEDPELRPIVAHFERLPHIRLRFYAVQPVGRARTLPAASLRSEVEGFCSACASPAITDDGRLTACNGPAYFARPDSPLQVGSLRQMPLETLLEHHLQDPILDTIRTFGPARLRDELKRTPGFEMFPFRERYQGMCDLCHHITSNPHAVRALRTRLAQPALQAARQAVWQVIDGSRREGPLSREYVNGVGACRVFLRAAWQPKNP